MRLFRLGVLILGLGLLIGCGNDLFATNPVDSSADGASDSGAQNDAPPPQDGGTEGSTASDGGPYCLALSPTPAFCADFDEADLTTAFLYGQASNSLVPMTDPGLSITSKPSGSSLPNALVADAPDLPGGPQLEAVLHQEFQASKSHFHIAFDFRLDAYTAADGISFFTFRSPEPGFSLHWDIAAGGGRLAGNSPTYFSVPTPMPPTGTWNHVDIDVTLGTPTTLVFLVLNKNAASRVDTSAATAVALGRGRLDLGIFSTPPASAARVSYDNVVYTEE